MAESKVEHASVRNSANDFSTNDYSVEIIGKDAFVHFVFTDGKPITVTEVPLSIALGIATATGIGGITVTLSFSAKRLMNVGEQTEHWCARYLGCSIY